MSDISLDNLLANMYRSNENFLKFIDALQQSYVDKKESVEFSWTDSDGNIVTKTVPSLSNLISDIKNIKRTNEESFNYSNRSISVKTFDGEVRRFVVSEPQQNPTTFNFPKIIENFSIKENIIKDKLIDPYTSVEIPIDSVTYPLYSKFYYLKLVINNDDNSISVFNNSFKGKIVNYSDCIKILEENSVVYDRNSGMVDFLPKVLKNVGSFSVLSIKREKISDTKEDIVYTLSSIRYRNADGRDLNLKVGDKLINNRTTIYEVTNITDNERKISVKLVEGFDPILRGVDNLVLFSDKINNSIEVPVGSEERFILFLKPINPVSNLVNNDWGTGNGIYLYDLKDSNNTNFFKGLTTDLWDKLKAISESDLASSSKIIAPRKPILKTEYFSVQMVNSHKKEYNNINRIKSLQSKKESDNSKMESLNFSLSSVRESLAKVSLTKNEEKTLRNQEQMILNEVDIISKSMKNTSNEIIELSNSTQDFKPKYAVVGVVPFTDPVFIDPNNKTGQQDIIGYELEYRYKSKDDSIEEFEAKSINDSNNSTKFIPSKWVKYEQILRKKSANGRFVDEKLNDPDIVKPNQYTISISDNEIVEMRIRGLSESGYPLKQIYGEWSDALQIAFPQELQEGMNSVIESAKNEKNLNEFSNELNRQKLINHAEDSFENKDVKFKHQATNISTNSKTPEQGNLSVQAVLDALGLDIEQIKQMISAQEGQMQVRILDSDDKELSVVKNNTSIKIDGGLYSEAVNNLSIKKGAIVDKTYYIEVENIGSGEIEIISYVSGKYTNPLTSGYSGYIYNQSEYNSYRKYNKVPLVLSDISSNLFNDYTFGRYYQNNQAQGQFLYSRFRDMTLNTDLYVDDPSGIEGVNLGTSEPAESFVWNGSETVGGTINGNGKVTDFCVHIKHPYLASNSFLMSNWSTFSASTNLFPNKNYDDVNNVYVLPPFSNSKYSHLNINESDYNKQLTSKAFSRVITGAGINDQIFKNHFTPEDQFLIGKKTCGMYVGIGSVDRQSLEVINNSYDSGEKMLKGNKKLIPIYTSSRLTDYYGSGDTGAGNIGGVNGATNVKYEKTIGIDILYKTKNLTKLFSFDLSYSMQYQNGIV